MEETESAASAAPEAPKTPPIEAPVTMGPQAAPNPGDLRSPAAPPHEEPPAPAPPREPPSTILLGFLFVALADVVVLALRLPPRLQISTRAMAHYYDAGHLLALGLLAMGLSAAWRRFGPRSRVLPYVALLGLTFVLGYAAFAEDLSGAADKITRKYHASPKLWITLMALGMSLSVPAAARIGRLLARPWIRVLGFGVGIALAVVNGMNYRQSYPSIHMIVAVVAAVLAGTSLQGGLLASVLELRARRTRAVLAGVAALASAFSLAVWPSNAVAILLDRQPSAVLFPFLGRVRRVDESGTHVPEAQREWFSDRSRLPPIPPSAPSLLPRDAIVILIGIDSMRADVLANDKHRAALPELFRLRDESVYFTRARAAGSSTAPSIAALFSGVYYSQLYWSMADTTDGLVYPHKDTSPRFPELLQAAGVTTVTVDGAGWLLNDLGIVRGFGEEKSLRRAGYPPASRMITPLLTRLGQKKDGPHFYFTHFLDAHAPYVNAGVKSSPFEGYVAELGLVDKEIRRLVEALRNEGLLERTCIVILADHGEAFGEHGMTWHAATLYDELLRVPLLFHAPGMLKPRRVDDDVSLVDVGPTILDLMGVATPGHYMGQSLTGYLRGEQPKLTRPIVAEARLKRAMLTPDGFKVIHDSRAHSAEIYDVGRDPRELANLFKEGSADTTKRLSTLLTFFRAHTLKRPGYKVPYRKW